MSNRQTVVALVFCLVTSMATAAAAKHFWPAPAATRGVLRPSVVQPRAVSGPAAGLYCFDTTEGGAGVHDLGWIPAGSTVDLDVESHSAGNFDPVATVVSIVMGAPGSNAAKVTTFYDNDSGGGRSPHISFVAPQPGTYVLLVSDQTGNESGCYRYMVGIR